MKKQFLVTVEIPEDVTITQMQEYIKESIETLCKSYHFSDPLFDLDWKSIKVRPYGH